MITTISARRFKCFPELDLDLAPLTLLSGANNTGKSTVLQALLLLRQSHVAGELQRGRLVLNGDSVRLGTVDDVLPDDAADASLELAVSWADGARAAFRFDTEPNSEIPEFLGQPPPNPAEFADRAPFSHTRYISADRIGPRATFPVSEAVVLRSDDVGPCGEFAVHYLAVHGGDQIPVAELHFEAREGREAAATNKLRYEVEAWLGLLAPDVQIQATLHRALDAAGLTFTFKGADLGLRTNERRSTHVGFGLTYVLPILVALLSARRGDLVLIENPEAHLHPRAQRELVVLISRAAAAGIQVVIETHSDHVLNGARLAVKTGTLRPEDLKLFFFTQDRDGRRVIASPKVSRDGRIRDWPKGFFDEWDRALDQLLID